MQVSRDSHLTGVAVDSVMTTMMSVGRLMRRSADGDTLDPGAIWLLKTVRSKGPVRVTELAGSLNLDTSTVSRHVAQLDRQGLLDRSPDPDDGRAQRVQLTPLGEGELKAAFDRRRSLIGRALEGWDVDDVHRLEQLLTRFMHDIDTLTTELEHA